jgi:hypothetical protein
MPPKPRPEPKPESPAAKQSAKGFPEAVADAILGQFSVKKAWSEPTPPEPQPADLVVIAAALAAAARQPVDSSHLKTALPLWEESWRLIYFEGLMKKRRAALVKLLFSEKQTVPLDLFLLKLLPKDEPAKRQEYLEDALLRASTIFAERFQRGGKGWPQEEACRLLGAEQAKGAAVLKSFQTQVGELGGVTLDLAVTYAPMILGWREFKSSPRARGSRGRQIRSGSGTQEADG